jgi:hypothetical protein
LLGIGEVSHKLPERSQKVSHNGWDRKNPLPLGKLRILRQVAHLNAVLLYQMLIIDKESSSRGALGLVWHGSILNYSGILSRIGYPVWANFSIF